MSHMGMSHVTAACSHITSDPKRNMRRFMLHNIDVIYNISNVIYSVSCRKVYMLYIRSKMVNKAYHLACIIFDNVICYICLSYLGEKFAAHMRFIFSKNNMSCHVVQHNILYVVV